ncbi:hypothetical protein ACFRAU_24790 [Arthrobacter sp. NPDC056691]|uniref:hypothetical protein n=1 Tax=Arthrobacter sp. NPDC056691 TaxID=3345913 RepID=UPI00366CA31C
MTAAAAAVAAAVRKAAAAGVALKEPDGVAATTADAGAKPAFLARVIPPSAAQLRAREQRH